MLITYVFHVFFLYLITTRQSGDFEQNSPTKPSSCKSCSIFHWNLNIVSLHNFKLSLLKACTVIHQFNVACLSETYPKVSIK